MPEKPIVTVWMPNILFGWEIADSGHEDRLDIMLKDILKMKPEVRRKFVITESVERIIMTFDEVGQPVKH